MRLLWSLPKAVPAILRHFAGYAELLGQDLERAQQDLTARAAAAAVVGVCLFFVLFSGCLLVLALTWDTPHRVAAIVWMVAGFAVAAVIAGLYRSNVVGSQSQFLGTVRKEWAQDRMLLDKILADKGGHDGI
jgi:uncharacterized membrane protein YqjE